ncbi:MAG: hypothetical protein IJ821_00670 [Lachnospiraceae bacterium]|nr:hypothetical protein [Lachnospiraceae bacterium]
MNTQNRIRNLAPKITAALMSAIFLAVSVNVPALAEVNGPIQDDTYVGDVVVDAGQIPDTYSGNVAGVYVNAADVSVGHDLSVNSQQTNTRGIYAIPTEGEKEVTIGHNLSVNSYNEDSSANTYGIEARPAAGGTAKITIGNPDTNEGNVTVTGKGTVQGIRIATNTSSLSEGNTEGNTNITVGGDVTATSERESVTGVYSNTTKPDSVTNVDIGGAVKATGITEAMGLEIKPTAHNTNAIDVGKGISASAAEATGVNVFAQNTSNTTINIGKDSSGDAVKVHSDGNNGNAANSFGISATLNTGDYFTGSTTATINVEGNIVVSSEAAGARGIYANGGARTNLNIQVKGDVTSNGAGIYTEDMSLAQSTDIIIDGTVKSTADGIPAVILDDSSINKVSITAWKIESNEGTALLGKSDGAQALINDNSQGAVANCISYIIRVTQPEINNTPANVLSLANADGTAWSTKKAWANGTGVDPTMLDVAGEGQKVYVKLDVPAGYQLAGVYADSARTVALTQGENGSYYLTVPRGGGIDVNVALTLIQVEPDPDPNLAPEPDPNPVTPDVPVPGPVNPTPDWSTDTSSSAAAPESAAPAPASAMITAAHIQSMILGQLSAMQTLGQPVTAIDLNLGAEPNLSADVVFALFDGNTAKMCRFTHNGQNYVLFIPVVDTGSAAFAQCLAILNAEPNGMAGPIRLSQIFAPVGATVSQE